MSHTVAHTDTYTTPIPNSATLIVRFADTAAVITERPAAWTETRTRAIRLAFNLISTDAYTYTLTVGDRTWELSELPNGGRLHRIYTPDREPIVIACTNEPAPTDVHYIRIP